jgi:hypothetical protein
MTPLNVICGQVKENFRESTPLFGGLREYVCILLYYLHTWALKYKDRQISVQRRLLFHRIACYLAHSKFLLCNTPYIKHCVIWSTCHLPALHTDSGGCVLAWGGKAFGLERNSLNNYTFPIGYLINDPESDSEIHKTCRSILYKNDACKNYSPLAARSKVWVCGHLLAGITGSNPAWAMNISWNVVCCQVEVSA